MDILFKDLFQDDIPSTACVMYVNDLQKVLRPVLSTTTTTEEANLARGRTFMPSSFFPNLSEPLKVEAVKLQQQNLQGFAVGFSLNGISPQELLGLAVHFGQCCEGQALLYILDPTNKTSRFYTLGAATRVGPIRAMRQYNEALFRTTLVPACRNCRYMVKAVNDALGTTRVGPNGQTVPALEYRDLAVARNELNGLVPPSLICFGQTKKKCNNRQSRKYECPYCRMAWYCSSSCMDADWSTHARSKCARYRWCADPACGAGSPSITCQQCWGVKDRIPARYCKAEHQARDWPTHKHWCQDRANKGPVPTLQAK
ncbi:hypothetical protein B0H17DRAFT_1039651 [Mycena rosella]|uniref:MYND-type domain-containing protein n=1 Tax=Mycena rosella TaxID=1033263 RepID=A0AAD7GSR2_MYCRO|nr:hypothetical protein B0H17DRAFT_1039651 [Mycena rosella]